MRRGGVFPNFQRLSRQNRRANENLYQRRTSEGTSRVIPIDSETVDFINSNQELFRQPQFDMAVTILRRDEKVDGDNTP